MNRISTQYLWMLAVLLLAGCSTEGCDTSRFTTLFSGTSADGTLQPYQIEGVKRDFCSKFRGVDTFYAGQTSNTPAVEGENPNLPALLQPYLRVTINGQSAEMNALMLDTMRRYLSAIDWPDSTDCHGVLVLSENSLLLEFPNTVVSQSAPHRGMVTLDIVSISSAWQKGPDRVWRLLQVHMSEGIREVPESQAPAVAKDAEGGAQSGAPGGGKPRSGKMGW
jgi:hypothetical protein